MSSTMEVLDSTELVLPMFLGLTPLLLPTVSFHNVVCYQRCKFPSTETYFHLSSFVDTGVGRRAMIWFPEDRGSNETALSLVMKGYHALFWLDGTTHGSVCPNVKYFFWIISFCIRVFHLEYGYLWPLFICRWALLSVGGFLFHLWFCFMSFFLEFWCILAQVDFFAQI